MASILRAMTGLSESINGIQNTERSQAFSCRFENDGKLFRATYDHNHNVVSHRRYQAPDAQLVMVFFAKTSPIQLTTNPNTLK